MKEILCPACQNPMRQAMPEEVLGGQDTLDKYDVRLCQGRHPDGLLGFIGFYAKTA